MRETEDAETIVDGQDEKTKALLDEGTGDEAQWLCLALSNQVEKGRSQFQ